MKKVAFLLLLLLAITPVRAQLTSFPQTRLDTLMGQYHYRDCAALADSLCQAIIKDKPLGVLDSVSSRQLLLATWYRALSERDYLDITVDSCYRRYAGVLPYLTVGDRCMAHLFLDGPVSVMRDTALYKQIRFDKTLPILSKEGEGFNTCPSLYFLVMNVASRSHGDALVYLDAIRAHCRTLPDNSDRRLLQLYYDYQTVTYQYSHDNEAALLHLKQLLSRYRTCKHEYLGEIYYQIAERYKSVLSYDSALCYLDTAITRYSKYEVGCRCRELKSRILLPEIRIEMDEIYPAKKHSLFEFRSRNLDTVFFRVVKYQDGYWKRDGQVDESLLVKAPSLAEWTQVVGDSASHRLRCYAGYLPPLVDGNYVLIASQKRDIAGGYYYLRSFSTYTAIALMLGPLYEDEGVKGYIFNYGTGETVPNVKVRLRDGESLISWVLGTTTTDHNGYFCLKPKRKVDYDEFPDLMLEFYSQGKWQQLEVDAEPKNEWARTINYHLITDRPVYRPGDTLHYMLLVSRTQGAYDAHVLEGVQVNLKLKKGESTVFSLDTVTNEHGIVSGEYVIPQQVLPGSYIFYSNDVDVVWVKIESYKQPTFQITLYQNVPANAEGNSRAPGLGDTVHVHGLAASYNEVALSHAQVKYTVTRRCNSVFRRDGGRKDTVICSGMTITDEVGLFDIAFVAEPDTVVRALCPSALQTFVVTVEVTSPSGESHSSTFSLDLAKVNGFLDIVPSRKEIAYKYHTRDGALLKGKVTLAIHRLTVPEQPYFLNYKNGDYFSYKYIDAKHTLSREEFHQRYPLFAYDSSEFATEKFPIEATVFSTTVECDGNAFWQQVPIPELPTGVYRIEMSAGEVSNREVMEVVAPEAEHVMSSNLFWYDRELLSGHVGDTVTLRVGSRFKGVRVVCAITCKDGIIEHQLLQLNDNIVTLQIPLTKEMLGRSMIKLYSVKEGKTYERNISLFVNPLHKQLDVKLASFRDKLLPGTRETFTFQVTDESHHQPVQAHLCLTMFDEALGSIYRWNTGRWEWIHFVKFGQYRRFPEGGFVDSYWNDISHYSFWVSPTDYYGCSGSLYKKSDPAEWDILPLQSLKYRRRLGVRPPMESDGIGTARGESGMVTMVGGVRPRGESGMVSSMGGVSRQGVAPASKISTIEVIDGPESTKPHSGADNMSAMPRLRTNLSTLAFFEPMLTTQADGSLSYTFTVPDLLTRWSLGAWAWTDDLCVGSYRSSPVITQQKLMITPTMPRFLRQGDTATLLAKVTNMADSALDATVTCTLDIKSTNQQINKKQINIPPHSTLPVAFPVQASVGGTVATYKFQVVGGNYSDGEQGPLPILSNRQGVTTSVAMCLQGEGRKEYQLALPQSSTAEPLSLTLEYTGNPMHMAMETLPYYQEQSDPSNLYLFNSYFVNTLGRKIAGQYPELRQSADNVSDTDNPLLRNQSTTQTLLEETPWLAAAQGETERLKRIAQYYDTAQLDETIAQAYKELDKARHANGGWSWMPNGKISSVYVTQQILQGLGEMNRLFGSRISFDESRAIGFLDRSAYDNYLVIQKSLKRNPKLTLAPDDIDYLYTRSFYPSRPFTAAHKQAYQFYYDNLKQHAYDYTSLRSQALLALVFHRQGDTLLAQEMIYRIKQRSMVSDEMGMFWRDNTAGYYYYQRPVEVQSYLIQAFREVTPADTHSVALMEQWLLLQKQTTSWGNNQATLSAIRALMQPGLKYNAPIERQPVIIALASDTLRTSVEGSSYLLRRFVGDSLQAYLQHETLPVAVTQLHKGVSWGSLCYQYTEQMDKVPASETGINITRKLYRVNPDKSLTLIKADGKTQLHVGDQVRIVIDIRSQRNYEYVQCKHLRSACMEPTSTASGWASTSSGLGYYVAINNTHDALYIDHLPKGSSVIEQNYYITNPGTFTLAPTVLQCLYAPEFRATSAGSTITIAE